MILDMQTMFSGTVSAAGVTFGQPITATAISENVLDVRNPSGLAVSEEGLGSGNEFLEIRVQTSADGADAAKTLTITLESSSTADLATTPVVHFGTGAILGAALVAGAVVLRAPLPSGDYKRYLGLRYTVSAGFTAFNILAYLSNGAARNTIFPSGFTLDA